MEITEVRVVKSFTRNLGNFESARVEVGLAAAPDGGESVDEVKARLTAKVDKWMGEDVAEIDADLGR